MADKTKEQAQETEREEFITLKIPESMGGTGQVTQFPVESFSILNDYLLSTGHEYLSTGTEEQQAAIERWQGLMPNRVEVEDGASAS